jgi:hypothetical protein
MVQVLSNLLSPGEGETLDRNISTKKFLKVVRRNTGHDIRFFAGLYWLAFVKGTKVHYHPDADRWIYAKGCPSFTCGFWFNRRKHVVEFAFKQNKSPAGRVAV